MFDVGFSELLVIGLVALVVIGPERLPKVARTAGQWLGRLNRYVSQVKQDIDRDIKLEELRKMQQDMKDAAQKYEILANETARQVETAVEQETNQISRVMEAMSVTDGGLAMQEYEKIKSGDAAVPSEETAALEKSAPAELPPGTEPGVGVADPATPAQAAETVTKPAQPPKLAKALEDYPDGPVG